MSPILAGERRGRIMIEGPTSAGPSWVHDLIAPDGPIPLWQWPKLPAPLHEERRSEVTGDPLPNAVLSFDGIEFPDGLEPGESAKGHLVIRYSDSFKLAPRWRPVQEVGVAECLRNAIRGDRCEPNGLASQIRGIEQWCGSSHIV